MRSTYNPSRISCFLEHIWNRRKRAFIVILYKFMFQHNLRLMTNSFQYYTQNSAFRDNLYTSTNNPSLCLTENLYTNWCFLEFVLDHTNSCSVDDKNASSFPIFENKHAFWALKTVKGIHTPELTRVARCIIFPCKNYHQSTAISWT